MITEELLRRTLHEQEPGDAPLERLLSGAVVRGRRRRRTRRVAAACGAAAMAAAVVGAGSLLTPAATPRASHPSFATRPTSPAPWWQTWPTGRHFGPLDRTFLRNVAAPYARAGGITVYASGSAADGTAFALYLDRADGHTPQWVQGWHSTPDFAQAGQAAPAATWMSFTSPTAAAHGGRAGNQQWLVVVGRPGTTGIDYSPDGSTWTAVPLEQGIGLLLLPDGFPPAAARVGLHDATGVFATGVPAAAGAGHPTPTPGP